MKLKQNKKMTYFTSWDVNVFLCLTSLGIPEDIVKGWIPCIKEQNRRFCLERDRSFHIERQDLVTKFDAGSSLGVIRDRRTWEYELVLNEYEKNLKEIEPEDRYDYFVWAYENFYYKSWNCHPSKRIGGFHPGRFYLMDLKRGVKMEDIRDLEDIGAWQEEKFIRKQHHVDVLIEKKNVHRMKRRVCREICHLGI